MRWWLAVASGLAAVLAFPPFDAWVLAWVAPALLIAAVRGAAPGVAFGRGLLAGLVFQSLLGWWLFPAGVNPGQYFGGALVCAAWVGAFGLGFVWLERHRSVLTPLAIPSLWCVLEWLRANLSWLAAPWGVLGYSQAPVRGVADVATIGGVWAVSFLLVGGAWLGIGLLDAGRRQTPSGPGQLLLAVALAALLVGGALDAPHAGAGTGSIRVAVIQAGRFVPGRDQRPRAQEVFEHYRALTREAARSSPSLVVWPESAMPASLPADAAARDALASLAREVHAHLLVSSSGRDKSKPSAANRWANSAFLFSPEGEIVARYDKVRLLPFNEYVPVRHQVAWPRWIADGVPDAEAGLEHTVFSVRGIRFATLICWENLFGRDFRTSAEQGVDFMVSLTNEGFEVMGEGRRQLFAINAFRALEDGVALVRASTTGVSAFVGPDGRVLQRVTDARGRDLDAEGFAVRDVPIGLPGTFYRRHGDWIVAFSLAILLAAGCFAPWGMRVP